MRTAPDESTRRKLSGSALGWRAAITFSLALVVATASARLAKADVFRLDRSALLQLLAREHHSLPADNNLFGWCVNLLRSCWFRIAGSRRRKESRFPIIPAAPHVCSDRGGLSQGDAVQCL
jgi:hypothetical protein